MIDFLDVDSDAMKELTIDEAEFFQYLSRHPDLKAIELAQDFEISVSEAESILNSLREKGRAVETYDSKDGYLWSAIQ